MLSAEEDAAFRNAAMQWLERRTNDGLDPVTTEELLDFTYGGEQRRLMDRQLGIYKPKGFTAALSIRTTYRPEGRDRPYDDTMGPDDLLRYKWRGEDPEHWNNRALRAAKDMRVPLIWFWGVAPATYKPIFPVFLVKEEVAEQQFVVATDPLQNFEAAGGGLDEVAKRYLTGETKVRIHQPVFRGLVMQAYDTRCAVCALGHSELLDAAHIVPDSEEGGIAAVRNGLALCKIHHAAYDAGILGVTPDRTVAIREDILEEVDGPVLEYGLKRLNGQKLRVVPRARKDRPDRELLDRQYQQFMSARTGRIDELWAPEHNGQRMDVRHERS